MEYINSSAEDISRSNLSISISLQSIMPENALIKKSQHYTPCFWMKQLFKNNGRVQHVKENNKKKNQDMSIQYCDSKKKDTV